MNIKKIVMSLLVLISGIGILSGCGKGSDTTEKAKEDKISIVCTVFPQYDWVKQLIAGQEDRVELTLLMDNGTDLHNYQPTAEDMVKISDCDIFIYVGGESDVWLEDAVKEAVNKDMKLINMMDVMGESIKEEEVVEGMQSDEHEGEEDEEDEIEYDEHIWLSLKNAQTLVGEIAGTLAETDSEEAEAYRENGDKYLDSLKKLDEKYEQVVSDSDRNTILFADRFPFRYMADDYGLEYYAAFVGCSAETEASFETIAFLSGKVKELELPAVLVLENSDEKIAKSIMNNASFDNGEILRLNSMQSVTEKDIEEGETYLSVMENNLRVLGEALN